jgi:hypothetical protein
MAFTEIKPQTRRGQPKQKASELELWRVPAGLALLCLLLIGSALLPYDLIVRQAQEDFDTVEQMPTDARVANVEDVIAVYHLNRNVRSYLSVREGRIEFDEHLPRDDK